MPAKVNRKSKLAAAAQPDVEEQKGAPAPPAKRAKPPAPAARKTGAVAAPRFTIGSMKRGDECIVVQNGSPLYDREDGATAYFSALLTDESALARIQEEEAKLFAKHPDSKHASVIKRYIDVPGLGSIPVVAFRRTRDDTRLSIAPEASEDLPNPVSFLTDLQPCHNVCLDVTPREYEMNGSVGLTLYANFLRLTGFSQDIDPELFKLAEPEWS